MKNTIFILIVAVTLAACGGKGGSDKKAQLDKLKKEQAKLNDQITKLEAEIAATDTTSKQRVIEVATAPIHPSVFATYVEIQGRVDAEESVMLSSEMPGVVTRINVKVGDKVNKGSVLAETDSRAIQQQLAVLQASLNLVNQTYDKIKSLWDQKIGTELQYLQVKTGKEALESSIAALQEQIRMTKVISPIDGTVDMVNIKLGQSIAPGMQAVSVVNFNNLKVKADVAETYADMVKAGDNVIVTFPDTHDTLTSKVNYASRSINNVTRTFGIEVFLDSKKEYHPNMVARVKINNYRSEGPVIAIPVKYIQHGMDEQYVMIVENGKAVKRNVVTGREYSGTAEIKSGLKADDQIITDGYDLVNDGEKVMVRK